MLFRSGYKQALNEADRPLDDRIIKLDAIVILVVVTLNAILGFVQEKLNASIIAHLNARILTVPARNRVPCERGHGGVRIFQRPFQVS